MNKLKSFQPINRKKWMMMLVGLTVSFGAFAQGSVNDTTLMLVAGLVGLITGMVLIVAIYVLRVLSVIVKSEEEKQAEASGLVREPSISIWQRILAIANNRVDMKDEEGIILDHDYDGIKELDNHLPPWWTYLFYATIVFAIVYAVAYHFTGSFPLQEEEYQMEMAEAAEAAQIRLAASEADGTAFSEASLAISSDPAVLASGNEIFTLQCAVCHKADGGGSIGPNLTDDYWIHGGDIKDIFNVIKVGAVDKGMISWEAILSPTQIRDVSNFIISLNGTDPPGAKAPQGELYKAVASGEKTPAGASGFAAGSPGYEEAQGTFAAICAVCHMPDAGGVVGLGPNLTDMYWKDSDGTLEGITNTISEGVVGTAMVSWKASFTEDQIEALGKYVLAFQGTSPANPIEPEGELYKAGDSSEKTPAGASGFAAGSPGYEEAQGTYGAICAVCHMPDAGGIVGLGPNLTDKYWKDSDGTVKGIKNTISEGVVGTAMVSWKASFNDDQIEALAKYILTFQGTSPANPIEPDGDLYE